MERKEAKKQTMAEFLTKMIAMSGKSQVEIARDLGYTKPNIITMFKQGLTNVPLSKVPLLAKSLGLDPAHLLRMALEEYQPDTLRVLEDVLGAAIVSESEMDIVRLMRNHTKDMPLTPNDDERKELSKLFAKISKRVESITDAATRNFYKGIGKERLYNERRVA